MTVEAQCSSQTSTATIALGANLGSPIDTITQTIEKFESNAAYAHVRTSSLYRTAPVDATGPDFINAVLQLQTRLRPLALLHQLQQLEHEAGRVRSKRNAPRTLDLDLILYDMLVIDSAELTVPHPRMHERAFVLRPLAELAPDTTVPGHGHISKLLENVARQQVWPVRSRQ